jgi:hypothetical protein
MTQPNTRTLSQPTSTFTVKTCERRSDDATQTQRDRNEPPRNWLRLAAPPKPKPTAGSPVVGFLTDLARLAARQLATLHSFLPGPLISQVGQTGRLAKRERERLRATLRHCPTPDLPETFPTYPLALISLIAFFPLTISSAKWTTVTENSTGSSS